VGNGIDGGGQSETSMKEVTTQEIIRKAPITKEMGDHWEITYYGISQAIQEGQKSRLFRHENSLLFFTIDDDDEDVASGIVFSIDPPRSEAKAYVEFCRALAYAKFKELTVHATNPLIKKLIDQAGYSTEKGNVEKGKNGKEKYDLKISLDGRDQ